MSAAPVREWRVFVHAPGGAVDCGTVVEDCEKNARCAAFSKFGADGDRSKNYGTPRAIYEDDDFDVRPA